MHRGCAKGTLVVSVDGIPVDSVSIMAAALGLSGLPKAVRRTRPKLCT